MSSNDAISIAKDAVLSRGNLATPEQQEILNRLVNRPEAHRAWRLLSEKALNKGTFKEVAESIADNALAVPLLMSGLRTSREIREASERAASLANELGKLIERNSTLENIHYELMPPVEYAALERILGVVNSQASCNDGDNCTDDFFPFEIERRQDLIQAQNHPEFHSMTTAEAYKTLKNAMVDKDAFLVRLTRFAQLAEVSSTSPPIVPHPKRASTKQNVFSVHACSTLVAFYGSPNTELVTDLASAAFNTTVNNETVKKWWQRRHGAI